MEPVNVYMNWMSPPSRAVMMVAAALDIPTKIHMTSVMDGDHLKPEFLKKNPQHTIPTIEDGDFIVWDSHAIAAYFVNRYGKSDDLYPKDPKQRALVDQRMHFDSSELFANFLGTIVPIFRQGSKTLPEGPSTKINLNLEVLDKILGNNKYLTGSTVTIGDLCCLATVTSINEIMPEVVNKYPKVVKWIETCKSLPYYEKCNAEGAVVLGNVIKNCLKANQSK